MGFLSTIGNWIWNGAKATASSVGIDTSAYENDEAQRFQAKEAEKNRDFQEAMLQKQMNYQTDMWNKSNEYNSAQSQMDRYRQAGLNPYMMMTGGANAGSATSQGSPSGSSSPSVSGGFANTHPGSSSSFIDSMTNMKLRLKQEQLMDEEIENWQIRNSLERERILEEIMGKRKDNRYKDIQNYWADDLFMSQKQQYQSQAWQMQTQAKVNMQTEIYNKLINAQLPEQLRSQIAVNLANVAESRSASSLNGYQQYALAQNVLESSARELGFHIDNQIRSQTIQQMVDIIGSDAFWRSFRNFAGGISDLFGGIGSLGNFRKKSYTYNNTPKK